jgi:hypothetical protein
VGLILLIVFFSSIWVYFDAKSIGVKKGLVKGFFDFGPWGWFWVSALWWFGGLITYLVKRGNYKRAAAAAAAQQQPTPSSPRRPPVDALQQLEKLGELRKSGVLTEEEFAAKKKELLGTATT